MEQHQSAGRTAHVVRARHRLLAAVAALGQVHRRPDPAQFVGQGASIGVDPQPRDRGRDPQRLPRPGSAARRRRSQQFRGGDPGHEMLRGREGRGTAWHILLRTSAPVGPGRSGSRPGELVGYPPLRCLLRQWFAAADASDDRPIGGHIRHLDLPQELHGPQVLDQRRRRPGLDGDPGRGPVIDQVEFLFDSPVRVQDQGQPGDARREVVEFGRGEVVQPVQPVRADDRDDTSVGQVHECCARQQFALFGQGIAVMPRDPRIGGVRRWRDGFDGHVVSLPAPGSPRRAREPRSG